MWAEATEAVQKFGAMVKSPTGYPIQSPYISIANRQAEIVTRIAAEFGSTPASRSRVAARVDLEPTLFDGLGGENAEAVAGGPRAGAALDRFHD